MNCLLKHIIEGKTEGGVRNTRKKTNSYWLALRKQENTGNLKRKYYTALCRELTLEEAIDLL
jgi:hypothetical protein